MIYNNGDEDHTNNISYPNSNNGNGWDKLTIAFDDGSGSWISMDCHAIASVMTPQTYFNSSPGQSWFQYSVDVDVLLTFILNSYPGANLSQLYFSFWEYDNYRGCNGTYYDGIGVDEVIVTVTPTNVAPTSDAPTISPSLPGNSDDITCSVSNVTDLNGDATTVAYDWRIGGNSYAKKYITFNSTSSSEVRDYSSYGSGENFTISGSPTETTGKSGKCYDFTATGQYIRNQSTTPIDLNGGVSVSIWSYSDNLTASPNYQQLFFLRDNSGGGGAQLVLREYGSGGMEAFVKTNGDLDWGPDYIYQAGLMTANTWYHWVLTYDGANTMLLYRNGVQVASTTTTESGLAIIDDICIGGSGTNNWFSGKLDEFRVYTGCVNTCANYFFI